jgi:hypothetical protein
MLSLSLIFVARVHSKTIHRCSSNQCDTTRLESKLTSIQTMFISSHEIEQSISNEAQRLVYQKQRRDTKQRLPETRSVPYCSKGTLPSLRPLTSVALSFFPQLSILYSEYILVSLTFLLTLYIFLTMMMIDHDAFLPAVVMTSNTPCCTNISRQYDGAHYNDNTAQHGDEYNSTPCTSLPLRPSIVRARLSLMLLYITINY